MKGSTTTARRCRPRSSASCPPRAYGHGNHPAAATAATRTSPARSTTSACWSKRSAARTSSSPSWWTPPTRCSRRSPRRTSTSAARCTCCPGALQKTGTEPDQGQDRRDRARADADQARARSPRRSPPPRKPRASSALETTPLIKNDIRPFAREIVPVVNELGPPRKQLAEAFPKLTVSFEVLNEFFNELAYNPGPKTGRLPVLPRLGQPQPQQRRQQRRRERAASGAASSTSTAKSCRSSKASPK